MRKFVIAGFVAATAFLASSVGRGEEHGFIDDAGGEPFAVLPDGVRFPEGIAANPATGEIYVGTFDSGPNANKLLRFGRNGRLAAQRDFAATPLLASNSTPTTAKCSF